MFDFIRTHQKLMQLILLVLVVPSFVFLGISGYSFVNSDTSLAEIGELNITKEEYIQAQRNQLQQLQESSDGRFDPSMLDTPEARLALLDQLINYKMQIAIASENHFSVSDATLRNVISRTPQFQGENGFSADRYNDFLASYGISPRDYEASRRGELALDIVLQPIENTAVLPTPVLNTIKIALTEERDIRLKVFNASDFTEQITINDTDVDDWYKNNQDQLRLPQQVVADYIVLDEAAAVASVPSIDTERLKEYYEQNKSNYVVPGRVNASHILVKSPASASEQEQQLALDLANEIYDSLKSNTDDFADVARSKSQDAGTARDGGELGWIQHGSLPADVEQALFALQEGDISKPVKGPDGYHILKANQVQPEQGESFEEAKPKLEEEVRRQLAAERFADMATNLTSLVYDDPTSLEPAAKSLGLEVRTASGIARDNLLDIADSSAALTSNDAAILDDVRVRQSLFSNQVLNDRQNSGVIEISPDTMVAVRVKDIIPAHVPELDLVTDKIKSILLQERSLDAAKSAGEQLLADLKAGTGGSVVLIDDANSEGSDDGFSDSIAVSRLDPAGLNKIVVDAALDIDGESLPYYGSVSLPSAFVVIQVDSVKDGVTDNPALDSLGLQLSRVWGASEEQAYLTSLRKQLGVVITPEGQQFIQEGDGSSD